MPEPTDMILPLLQRLQSDMTALRGKADDIAEAQVKQGEKLAAIEGLMTYHLGVTSTHTHELDVLKAEVADIRRRLAALESRP